MNDALVIIPTYNEIENISNIIDAVMQLEDGFDVLVIDDASPDGTQDVVRTKISQYPGRVYMETREGKRRPRHSLYPWIQMGSAAPL